MRSQKLHLRTRLNGEDTEFLCEARQTLLEVLREDLGQTGTKEGCSTGDCGSCSVILDGRVVCSCLVMAAEIDGRNVETVEGLADGDQLNRLQRNLLEVGGVQCGFCTPGMLMSATALLDQNPEPSDDEIRIGLSGNLCRCTGYYPIMQAVQRASVVDVELAP